MADPGWGIWGKCPPPPPPPHFVEEPCWHAAIFLIKALNFVRPRSVYKTHEDMHILLAFITNSPNLSEPK